MDEEFKLVVDDAPIDNSDVEKLRMSATETNALYAMLLSKLGEVASEYNRKNGGKVNAVTLIDAVFTLMVATINELLGMDHREQEDVVDFVYLVWKTLVKQKCYSRRAVFVPFASYYNMKSKLDVTIN